MELGTNLGPNRSIHPPSHPSAGGDFSIAVRGAGHGGLAAAQAARPPADPAPAGDAGQSRGLVRHRRCPAPGRGAAPRAGATRRLPELRSRAAQHTDVQQHVSSGAWGHTSARSPGQHLRKARAAAAVLLGGNAGQRSARGGGARRRAGSTARAHGWSRCVAILCGPPVSCATGGAAVPCGGPGGGGVPQPAAPGLRALMECLSQLRQGLGPLMECLHQPPATPGLRALMEGLSQLR